MSIDITIRSKFQDARRGAATGGERRRLEILEENILEALEALV